MEKQDMPSQETMDVQDDVPNLIEVGEIPANYAMRVETDILEPVVSSDTFARFTLQRKGFLSSMSKLTFSLIPNAGNDEAYVPLGIGIFSAIKNATLKIGQTTVCETQGANLLASYQSLFTTNESNKEREQFVNGRCISHESIFNASSDSNASTFGLSNGKSYKGDNLDVLNYAKMDGGRPKESPIYSLFLSDLFSFLKSNQLPAYLFGVDQEIHVELTFSNSINQRACITSGDSSGLPYLIDTTELKMIYDTIYYEGSVMERYRQQNAGGISFSYVDYRLSTFTGTEASFADQVFQVGGNGRLVNKVIIGVVNSTRGDDESILNGYVSNAPSAGNKLTLNLRYNDRFVFSIDRDNPALLFHTVKETEGMVPFVMRGEYSNEGQAMITEKTFQGHDQKVGLEGAFNWTSIRLNREERVNNKGIELTYKNTLDGGNYSLYVWTELRKTAQLVNGQFSCYFA
jgi:hypothetical protein